MCQNRNLAITIAMSIWFVFMGIALVGVPGVVNGPLTSAVTYSGQ